MGAEMRLLPAAIALLMLGLTVSSTAALFSQGGSPARMAEGKVRCEGAGAVVINIDGADYAVNGMASRRYPLIQRVWNSATYPEININRIIVRGLTLCDWGSKRRSTMVLKASAIN
jgi:hypothetical protein